MKDLNILIVEDDSEQAVAIEGALMHYTEPHYVSFHFASNRSELLDRLSSGSLDIAVVDFDLNETGDWRMDAIQTAFDITKFQPSCLKIGLSFSGVLECIDKNDSFGLKTNYNRIMEKQRFIRGESYASFRTECKKYRIGIK